MSIASALIDHPRLPALALVGVSLAALAAALVAQHGFGLFPCELCIWQRWAYAAAIGTVLPAAILPDRPAARSGVLALGAVAFLAGAGIALFHVGVEQHWWKGLAACSAAGGGAGSIDELRAQILAAPVARCDEIPWSLFGISMAGYNLLLMLALAALSAAAALAALRRSRG